ncbi:MAG: aminopeptidase P family protein [Deltaproteobacteria bacterium]|nr:aminopeptidase P family protein [Deltaproteobacteria bacterium]
MSANQHQIEPTVFAARRRTLAEAMGGRPVLLMGHRPVPRNYLANPFPFRQDSTLLYYTGVEEAGAACVIEAGGHTTLYLHERTAADALWHGELPSLAEVAATCGAEEARPVTELAPGDYATLPIAEAAANAHASSLVGRTLDPADVLGTGDRTLLDAVIAQRSTRDWDEVLAMRWACFASKEGHVAAMEATRPGTTDSAIQALIEGVFALHGMGTAYPSIVTARGDVLHGHATGATLKRGDLLLVDAGAEGPYGYASDITRTWPVSGTFTPRQADVYDAVLAANEASIALVKPGVNYQDVHLESARVLTAALRDWGLLRGDIDGLVEQGAHAVFFPHGVGHLLGLDVHDMELFGDHALYAPGRDRSDQFGLGYLRLNRDLEEGMVVTVEPGLYWSSAILRDPALRERLGDSVEWVVAEQWVGLGGIRIEDDVLVTADGSDILSEATPKKRDEIEELVGSGLPPKDRMSPADAKCQLPEVGVRG